MSNDDSICQISDDGLGTQTCNLTKNLRIIYNGLDPVEFSQNDKHLFSDASDPNIQAAAHSKYLKEVRKVYGFVSCPNKTINTLLDTIKNNTDPDGGNDVSAYAKIIENSQCQSGTFKPTVFQDPCGPLGVFPDSTTFMGVDSPAAASISEGEANAGNYLLTNFYCKSGSPQKHTQTYASMTSTSPDLHVLNEEQDLIEAMAITTKSRCEGKQLNPSLGAVNSDISVGSWIPTYDLTFTSPEFNIQSNDINYRNVKNTLNAGALFSPENAAALLTKFSFTSKAEIPRGNLSQAELACTKEDNCTGFLLSKDLRTSYLLGPTASPTVLTSTSPSPPSQYIFYYKKNNGPGSGTGSGTTMTSTIDGGMCIPKYYNCGSEDVRGSPDLCNLQSKCTWATPVNKFPDTDTDLKTVHAIDKQGCYPLDYDGASTILDTGSVLLSQTVSQSLTSSDTGEVVWYNDSNPEYKHSPSAPPSLSDINKFKENCEKIKGKTVGVKEPGINDGFNDAQAGANSAFIFDSTNPKLYAPSGKVQYYCIPKTKLTACGIGNNRGEPVQCCSGHIINTMKGASSAVSAKNGDILDLGPNASEINGPICLGGGHPLGPPCKAGTHENAESNKNNLRAPTFDLLNSPTCAPTIALICPYAPTIAPTLSACKASPMCAPTCAPTGSNGACPYAPTIAPTLAACKASPSCTPTCASSTITNPHYSPNCSALATTNTYQYQQLPMFYPDNGDFLTENSQGVGWTYQASNPPSQSPSDPSQLIYPGGAGELVTNNPNACWYNAEVMKSGGTPDNIIMSQFRNNNLPVIRAASTLRNDSCWAYKSGWKSAEEISPIDYSGSKDQQPLNNSNSIKVAAPAGSADFTGNQSSPVLVEPFTVDTRDVKENYEAAPLPPPVGNDYSWFPKPVGWSPDPAFGSIIDQMKGDKTPATEGSVPPGIITGSPIGADDISNISSVAPDFIPNQTQQFYNMGWNGGYIEQPGQYKYPTTNTTISYQQNLSNASTPTAVHPNGWLASPAGGNRATTTACGKECTVPEATSATLSPVDKKQIPNFSLSWLGGCNPITSTSITADYTLWNTRSYNYNACGNNCGGNCVMCNNWPENQVAKWNGGERKRGYVNWLPCKLSKNVNHLPSSLVCRNCGPLRESNVPNYSNTSPAGLESTTNNYLWYPDWKLVGGVNGLWMQSSDGMCRSTKKLKTSTTIPKYPYMQKAFNPAATVEWDNDSGGGCTQRCSGGASGTAPTGSPTNWCTPPTFVYGATTPDSKTGLYWKTTPKQTIVGDDGQGCTTLWKQQYNAAGGVLDGLGQGAAGSDILEGNINNETYKQICQTFPSDQVHIPYTLWNGMFPSNLRNNRDGYHGHRNGPSYKYMQDGDLFGRQPYATRNGTGGPTYPSFSSAYPGSWCLTSIDQTYIGSETSPGWNQTHHFRKMFSIGLSQPPPKLTGADTSFLFKAFTFTNGPSATTTSVWPKWGNDCGNQGQWDNTAIRNDVNSSQPLTFNSQVALNRLNSVKTILSGTPTAVASPASLPAAGFGGSLDILPTNPTGFSPTATGGNWFVGGGGYNAHAGIVQVDGGSCASGRMICNNSYSTSPAGNALPADPRCMGGANYNIGYSSEYSGVGNSPFGGTYMCWPEDDNSFLGSGYAQSKTSCSYEALPSQNQLDIASALNTKDDTQLMLPVSTSKSCQEDSDCREISGCIWSGENTPGLGDQITNTSEKDFPVTAKDGGFDYVPQKRHYNYLKLKWETDSAKVDNYGLDLNYLNVAYNDPKNSKQSDTWKFGENKFTTPGRWPVADQSMDRSKAYCHKPTNLCIIPPEGIKLQSPS